MSVVPTVERETLGLYALAALSGGLLAWSYALHPMWWAAWLAPAPVIAAVLRTPAASRRWLTLLAGAIGGASSFAYHVTVGGWAAAILILALVAIAWSSAIRLAALFAEREQVLPAMFAVPLTWAAIDTFLIHASPHGSAGSIAYSQMSALPVIQIASLGGVPAITFTVLLPGSLLGLWFGREWGVSQHRWRAPCGLAMIAVGAALIYGIARLHGAPPPSGTSIALIATDSVRSQPRDWDMFWQIYGDEIDRVTLPNRIVLLPESVVRLSRGSAEQAARGLARYAARNRATIVIGIVVEETGRLTNRALIALPDGTYRWYLKQHLVPGIEGDMAPGSSPTVLRHDRTIVGIAICKDMHFPILARDYARQGVGLMLVPANDFDVDAWLAARMTMLRGVETGSSIARAARNGISFVSDRYGRILAERRSDATMGALIASAPADRGNAPFFGRFGDVFGWGCVLGLGGLWMLRLRRLPSRA